MPATLPPFDYEATLEACARGDAAALRALYEREAGRLLGVVKRILRNDAKAQELLQQAFVQVWQQAGAYQRPLGTARAWIYTVVRHQAVAAARLEGVDTPPGEPAALAPPAALDDSPAAVADAEALARCMAGLNPARRACIVLAFVDGHTHEQIAKALTQPVGTVKSSIRRALLVLREGLP